MEERFEQFLEVHKGLPRQAPGSAKSTQIVCDIISHHIGTPPKKILDVGCGPGINLVLLLNNEAMQVLYSQRNSKEVMFQQLISSNSL